MTPGRARPDDRPEPLYARQVFERLREALDVLVEDDALIAWDDSYIKPNYELRDDGAWLRTDSSVDSLNWVPACDLEEGPASPDPLTTPALPFPFTARHLAAFMLHGWGWPLHQRFAGEDEQLDADAVKVLLGGVRDAKPREAIAGAFEMLARGRQQVGEPDMSLSQAEQAAVFALDEATKEAGRLHDWREAGIAEQERNARVRRRNEMTAAAEARLRSARDAREKDDEVCRKALVRWLLRPESRKLSPEEWSKLTKVEMWRAWLDGRAPEPTPVERKQDLIDWYDSTVRADFWLRRGRIGPAEAAQLLSGHNPLDPTSANWLECSNERMNPEARRELLRGCQDLGDERPLIDWLQYAKRFGLRYDPWIDEYIAAAGDRHPRPASGMVEVPLGNTDTKLSTVERQARRYQACVEAGLSLPSDDYSRLPRGIGKVAKSLGIARQTLAADLMAHIARQSGRSSK